MQSPAAHSMPTAWTKSLGKASDLLFRCTINALCSAHAEQHALVQLVEEYTVVNHDTLARMAEYACTAAHEELHAKVYLEHRLEMPAWAGHASQSVAVQAPAKVLDGLLPRAPG